MRRLGYPSRQTLYQWLSQRDASHEGRTGRPWSHHDPEPRAQAVSFVRSGMAGRDVAAMLGVSSAAAVHDWVRAAENPSPVAADGSSIVPTGDSRERAHDGFEGSLGDRVRQPGLENDMLRAVAKVLKSESPSPMTNREKALVINELRATAGRSPKGPAASLRISKSSHEHRRKALARPDKCAGLRARVREAFEGANESRDYRYVEHEPGSGDDLVIASEKVVHRIMREERLVVAHAKKKARCSSYEGEISDAPESLAGRDFHASAPNEPWLADITEFGLPDGKAYPTARPARRPSLTASTGAGGPVDRDELEREARQLQPRGRVRDSFRRAAAGDPPRPRMPLPLARVDCDLRQEPPGQADVEEGVRPRQLGDGGLLRKAQERVLPPLRLVGRPGPRVLPHARRVSEIPRRGAAQGEAGLDESDAVPKKPGTGRIAGPKKRPHPRTLW